MKKIYIVIFFGLIANYAFSQTVEAKLSEAKSAYSGGNLDDTRFALQQALQEVDITIGKEVLKMLPTKMGNLSYIEASDNVMGTGGTLIGVSITREFGGSDQNNSANIQIMNDSPLMAGINAILAMPMLGGGDPNQKRIRVDGYRGLLQKNESEGSVSYDVQIPFSSSLLTFHCEGIANENEVMTMVNSIPVSKIAEMIK